MLSLKDLLGSSLNTKQKLQNLWKYRIHFKINVWPWAVIQVSVLNLQQYFKIFEKSRQLLTFRIKGIMTSWSNTMLMLTHCNAYTWKCTVFTWCCITYTWQWSESLNWVFCKWFTQPTAIYKLETVNSKKSKTDKRWLEYRARQTRQSLLLMRTRVFLQT